MVLWWTHIGRVHTCKSLCTETIQRPGQYFLRAAFAASWARIRSGSVCVRVLQGGQGAEDLDRVLFACQYAVYGASMNGVIRQEASPQLHPVRASE